MLNAPSIVFCSLLSVAPYKAKQVIVFAKNMVSGIAGTLAGLHLGLQTEDRLSEMGEETKASAVRASNDPGQRLYQMVVKWREERTILGTYNP